MAALKPIKSLGEEYTKKAQAKQNDYFVAYASYYLIPAFILGFVIYSFSKKKGKK
jgi:hypothetical protein